MKTKEEILGIHGGMKEDTLRMNMDDICYTPRESLRAMDEYSKQQIFAFIAFREDQLALGFIPSGEFLLKPIEEQYALFIEHQNKNPK